jgi:HCOMODA/2-hydroxy-3-carboxy-muconic semialdehyde decarboxylase
VSPISPQASDAQQRVLRVASRALGRANLVHAYGHCSLRLDDKHLLVCAAMPMGLVTNEPGVVVPIRGPLPPGVLGEVCVHQRIYAQRPEVGAVVRSMPRYLMSLSSACITPVPRHGPGSYFAPNVPLWRDVQLVRSETQAQGVVETLGASRAVVMRANGAIVVGTTLEEAVTMTWFLEDAARMEYELRAIGAANGAVFSEEDSRLRATTAGRIIERMWDYLTAGDAELDAGTVRS